MWIKFTTGLGPAQLRCASCGTVFDSGLREWGAIPVLERFRYVVLSCIYGVLVGLFPALLSVSLFGLVTHNTDRTFPPNSLMFTVIGLWAFLVLVLQAVRVFLSGLRSEASNPEPMLVSRWNWQINLHSYAQGFDLVCLLLYLLVAFLPK